MNPVTLTAKQILALKTPEQLFSRDGAKVEWKRLTSRWHPDTNPGVDPMVLAHVNLLYDRAVKKLAAGEWVIPGQLDFTTTDHRTFQLLYKSHHRFEIGDMYVGQTAVTYLIDPSALDLADVAKSVSFKYADPKMKEAYSRYLPETVLHASLPDGRRVIVYKKTPDVLLLRDVIDHYARLPEKRLAPAHVAWLTSRLLNLACYLRYAGLAHNHISPETVFISPKYHSAVLLGGWWYSAKLGAKLTAAPLRTIKQVPADLIKAKVGNVALDGWLIKATARETLGDVNGSKLLLDKVIPKPMLDWLRAPGSADPVKDYKIWSEKILLDSFGPRKFVELNLSADDIYEAP